MPRIPDHEFLPQAQQIPEGHRRKVEHCGSDASMIINHKPDGYSAHCFRCHGGGWVKKERTLAQIMASLQAAQEADHAARESPALPAGCVADTGAWPDWARVWLHKAGLSRANIEELRFVYSPAMQRVVLPVYDRSGHVVFWQARGAPDTKGAKYLSPYGVDRTKLIPRYGKPCGTVVLTEDILSAVKVGFVCEAWSCMGTVMHTALLLEILERKLRVVVALDPDYAGITAGNQITQQLKVYGVPVHNMVGSLRADPKLLARSEIASLLEEIQWTI